MPHDLRGRNNRHPQHHTAHAHLAVFSEHGFTRDLNTTTASRPDVHLVDLAQLYGRH
jgi:hypothetical protein